jgi:hypothetical protein
MPLPVTGGIIVKASPMQHSLCAAARDEAVGNERNQRISGLQRLGDLVN